MAGTCQVSRRMCVARIALGILLFASLSLFPLAEKVESQTGFDPKAKSAQEAIEFLVLANRILANESIFDCFGHVSVRNPENPKTFFISRALAPEMVTKSDILEVDFDGNVVTKTTMKPYQERIIHAAIYKARSDVNSVVHAHPAPIIAFSVLNIPLRPVAHPAARFYQGVPVYDEYDFKSPGNTGMLVTTKEEGDRVATSLGKGLAMLMRGHGYNVVGPTLPDLVSNAISLRDNAVILMAALQLGKPKYISDEEARESTKTYVSPERAWTAWVLRVKKTMPDLR
jgi:3-hydroxy-2-methylpyridine-4,5-dicarboxylate 4-decarboxylase